MRLSSIAYFILELLHYPSHIQYAPDPLGSVQESRRQRRSMKREIIIMPPSPLSLSLSLSSGHMWGSLDMATKLIFHPRKKEGRENVG